MQTSCRNPEMDTVEPELASEQVEEDFEQTRDVLSESGQMS